ncbi:cysteinyl-tRNA synthetase [Bradyrhizobium sp. USDA 377]
MELRLYDTLTKEKRPFVPLDPKNVRMYVCGPTVYDFAHIGNARPVIVFDVLFRLLRHLYGEAHVKYVRNITDVDDKINDRAARDFPGLPLNEAIRKVTEETGRQFHADVDALVALRPSVEPRATEHIAEMREIIERLLKGGFAYAADDHVLFSPQAMNAANSTLPRYGALSNRSLDEMVAGARVDVAPYKKGNTDFVLWKPSKPGEPSWPSPAGIAAEGRPGWHIECSAMAWKHLGEHFDIHGGGIDLVFPHHENEVAQTCCAFHRERMANTWMHNGFLQVEGEKMSKSLGNFVTIRELLGSWTGPVIRYSMLQTHYRQPIDWTVARLEQSRQEIGLWAAMYSGSAAQHDYQQRKFRKIAPTPTQDLVDSLRDDLNTPNAVAVLRKQFSERSSAEGLTPEFFQNCEFLGLLNGETIGALEDTNVSGSNVKPGSLFEAMPHVLKLRAGMANNLPDIVQQAESELAKIGVKAKERHHYYIELVPLEKSAELDVAAVDALISERAAARARKDFKESDRIRDQLAAMGIAIKDSKDGTTWEVAR